MILQYVLGFFIIFSVNNGQPVYKQSSDCPGNLKWSTTGKTIMGNGYGSEPNQLKYADGLFIEPKTKILYVADGANNRVQKLYPNGEIKTAAGQPNGDGGSTADKLTSPADVFADENENVYVADLHNERIQYWPKDAKKGQIVAGNASTGSALNQFHSPTRVLLDSKKNLIIIDMLNQRVMQWSLPYDPAKSVGTLLAGGNGAGFNPNQLNLPVGLDFDEANGMLYIANDESNAVIQWSLDPYVGRSVYAGIPGRPGSSPAQLAGPAGLTLDHFGNLYIVDSMNHRIQMFCPNAIEGITVAGTGQLGNGTHELCYPQDVAFDSDMNLYVTDTFNFRIQKFERIQ